jgi:hypothetical protein
MAQVFRFCYSGQVGHRLYRGASARSRKGPIVYTCPCGERFRAEVWLAVESDDAETAQRLIEGSLNLVQCPSCQARAQVEVPVLYHDLSAPRLTLVLPDSLRHRELAERARLFDALAADAEPPPLYVLEPEVVFGATGLRASLAPQPSAGDFVAQPTTAPAPPKTEEPPEIATRVRINVPDPRQAMIDRWIAGREGPAVFLVEEQVLVCAALPPATLEHFLPGQLELRVQLHRLPNYPVVALTLVAPEGPDEERVLTVPLDVARAAHRVALEALAQQASLTLELYDHEYLAVVAHPIVAPLEENLQRILGEAKDALERLAPAMRSFERARAQVMAREYDRLGRTPVDLPDEHDTLERPSAVRAALKAVARWSEPGGEAYLLEIRSLPLAMWRAIRSRVIRRALDAGIAVPRPLVERSAKEHPTPLPMWSELLAVSVRRFAEVAARQRANDLSAVEEAENWDLLLRECALAGVIIDDEVRQLAAASVKRARAGTAGAGVDLRTLTTDELVTLLERKELRREVAVILCERHEPQTLPGLFAAIRRMARAEANVVLPAVTAYGPSAEKWLLEGLKSKKSFMRQGCALAVGTLKTPLGVDALVKLLITEPTEIWSEVARALGDVGAQAVMPLAAKLRDVDPELRERIVTAMAHVAARGVRGPVEMLASGRDALVGALAKRALGLVGEVAHDDQVVRRGAGTDHTVVRGFSRRFYDALGGGIELSAADLEEVDDTDGIAVEASASELQDDDDEDLRTATDLPVLRAGTPASGSAAAPASAPTATPVSTVKSTADSTAPRPRTLPRDR